MHLYPQKLQYHLATTCMLFNDVGNNRQQTTIHNVNALGACGCTLDCVFLPHIILLLIFHENQGPPVFFAWEDTLFRLVKADTARAEFMCTGVWQLPGALPTAPPELDQGAVAHHVVGIY